MFYPAPRLFTLGYKIIKKGGDFMSYSSNAQERNAEKVKKNYSDCQIKEIHDEYDIILNIFNPNDNSRCTCIIHGDGHMDWY